MKDQDKETEMNRSIQNRDNIDTKPIPVPGQNDQIDPLVSDLFYLCIEVSQLCLKKDFVSNYKCLYFIREKCTQTMLVCILFDFF